MNKSKKIAVGGMIALLLAALLGNGCVNTPGDHPVAGRWEGELTTPAITLNLQLNIRLENGRLRASLDIPRENILRAEVETIIREGTALRFTLPQLAIFFRGHIDPENHVIRGDLVRGRDRKPVVWETRIDSVFDLEGNWQTRVRYPSRRLGLTFSLATGWRGTLSGHFFCPELDAVNVPLDTAEFSDNRLVLASRLLGGRFQGMPDSAARRIGGTWTWNNAGTEVLNLQPVAAGPITYRPPANTNDGWKPLNLLESERDSPLLDSLMAALNSGRYPDLHSLLFARDSLILFEQYFGVYRPETLQSLENATTGVTALLAGIAIADGALRSSDQAVYPLLNGDGRLESDQQKSRLTLAHLLSMRSGLGCNDDSRTALATETKLLRGLDWARIMLDLPMAYPPGEVWAYCAGNYAVVGAALEAATGMRLDQYAEEKLFTPLKIAGFRWGASPAGRTYGAGMLSLTARDALKIARLVTRSGDWDKSRIVSEEWIATMTGPQARTWGENAPAAAYGFGWWPREFSVGDTTLAAVFAAGRGSQFFIAVPGQRASIVITAGNRGAFDPRLLELLRRYILPFFTDVT